MTLDELLRRIKASSVTEVLQNIAHDPEENRDFTLTLGPHLLGPLVAEDRRKHRIIKSPDAVTPRPQADWARANWQAYYDWYKNFHRGVGDAMRTVGRIVNAYRQDEQLPYTQLRGRLNEDDAAQLDRMCGRVLAA